MTARPHSSEFRCPACGGSAHKRSGPLSFGALVWVLNPGIAPLELALGIRVPREVYTCTSCPSADVTRGYLRCAACGRFHNGKLWAKPNHFWHWHGLVCADCGDSIPSLRNAWVGLILLITLPVWWLPARWHRPKWIAYEQARVVAMRENPPDVVRLMRGVSWIRQGVVVFGGLMALAFVTMTRLSRPDAPLQDYAVIVGISLLMGLGWGLVMRWWMRRKLPPESPGV